MDKLLVESYQAGGKVDRDSSTIHDVLILGETSQNGFIYPPLLRDSSRALFEGAKCYLDHEADHKNGTPFSKVKVNRPYQSRIGKYLNVHNTTDGLRGDLKLLKSHPWANVVMDAAEEAPDMFCCSPAMGAVWNDSAKDSSGNIIVTSIGHVRSIDLVGTGGTTKSLFEEEDRIGGEEEEGEESTGLEHYKEACRKFCDELIESALDGDMPLDEALKTLKDHLKKHMKMFEKEEEKEEPLEETGEGENPEGSRSGGERGEKPVEEELKLLKLEKEVRLLIESNQLDYDNELLTLLMDLPDSDSRIKHLNYLKRGSLVKKAKSGYKNSTTTKPTNYNASEEFNSYIRS